MTREDFWTWFEINKTSLENFISGKVNGYEIYETLSDKLKQYNQYLIPELTINEQNIFILIISCDGNKRGIPFADALMENLKGFENWQILKFRQPGPMEFIPINGLRLKRNNIFLEWQKTSSQKYYVTCFVKGYSPYNSNYETGVLLHLDHTIGEYAAMTQIEGVQIKRLGLFQSKKYLKSLDDLKIEIEST